MRVTIRRNGVIVNIIIAQSVESALALFPGCTAEQSAQEDEIPPKKTESADAALYRECLEIISGEAEE